MIWSETFLIFQAQIDDPRHNIDGYFLETCDHHVCHLHVRFLRGLTNIDECLIMEVKVCKKKCFINKFECTLNNFEFKNPYISLLIGDFNAKNTKLWSNVNNNWSVLLDKISTHHNLHHMIDQPTHFRPGCPPSCIDLLFSSEPNLINESGVYSSLVNCCHHRFIFAKINYKDISCSFLQKENLEL